MSKLFTPIKIRELEVKNRLWVSPMCMYSCRQEDGVVGQWHLVHLGSRAVGGSGLVMAEASAVNPEGRISLWCPGIWNDVQVTAWKIVTDFIRAEGSKSAIQLAHAGRKASMGQANKTVGKSEGGWETYSATDVAFEGYASPRMLTTNEIPGLVQDFANAAKNAVLAGFDALEIHAAHGYLIHQFLSPITNKRQDEYGGSLENRARFLTEIVQAVRLVIPEGMPLMIRFSATDYVEGGWDQAQTNQVAIWCKELGVDLFDLSSGGLVTGVKIPTGPGYQVGFAQSAKLATQADVIAVGQITDATQAEVIIASGQADVAMVGREFLRDPYFALRAAHELGEEVSWPTQYERGKWPVA
ncbi:NADH:flavin oxidoreductase/NADH oxidase [Candidatus Aquiluna sp. UB-MaderosW2red]|uniref:NADH:flavin oxidoreductase/NADH oxidase n=1 Tax=Candidatus Aquiluna sp. UB-MaderosW2red TaxID=1855377 RepID=UPI000875CABC|nr:NADH:flavin oxidoreductase/NADH oxidase [Candidatus Aquiluna sp. UB-MaderosW2red]SCX09089.1 2,4-dienoyl-CoA reductase [Candidatus Aquiluna sp. UB-MaderosW2red]